MLNPGLHHYDCYPFVISPEGATICYQYAARTLTDQEIPGALIDDTLRTAEHYARKQLSRFHNSLESTPLLLSDRLRQAAISDHKILGVLAGLERNVECDLQDILQGWTSSGFARAYECPQSI
jgi:hypothetical protein